LVEDHGGQVQAALVEEIEPHVSQAAADAAGEGFHRHRRAQTVEVGRVRQIHDYFGPDRILGRRGSVSHPNTASVP
jgi:hypothetical protein